MKAYMDDVTLVVEAENEIERFALGAWDSLRLLGHGVLLLRNIASLPRDDIVLEAINDIHDVQLTDNTWREADAVRDQLCAIFYRFAEKLGVKTEDLRE